MALSDVNQNDVILQANSVVLYSTKEFSYD